MSRHHDARSYVDGGVKGHTDVSPSSGFCPRDGGIPGDLPLAPNAAHVHTCVSSSALFPSQVSLILEDLMGNLLNFPLRIILTRPCQQGSDCASNKVHMRRCGLRTKHTEWKCLSRQWWL